MIIYFPTGFLDIRYHSSDSRYLQKIDQGLNYNRSILGNKIFFLKSSLNTILILFLEKNPYLSYAFVLGKFFVRNNCFQRLRGRDYEEKKNRWLRFMKFY